MLNVLRTTPLHLLASIAALAIAVSCAPAVAEPPASSDTPPPGAFPGLYDETDDPNSAKVPVEIRGLEVVNKLGEHIPFDLTFGQVDGSTVKLGEFFGRTSPDGKLKKPVVLMMVYLRCPILCPMVLEKFTQTLNQLEFTAGTEYDALVISFDPRDAAGDAVRARAEQLLSYRQPTTQAIRDGWNFLTCDRAPANARALADALGFPFRYLKSTGEFAHGAAVFVITPEGKISRYLLGLDYPARDVRLAIVDAGQGKVGTLLDRFTLWCYHYDPTAGVYTLAAMRVMQVGASLGAILLGTLIFGLLRFERRKRRRAAATAQPGSSAPSSLFPPLPAEPRLAGQS